VARGRREEFGRVLDQHADLGIFVDVDPKRQWIVIGDVDRVFASIRIKDGRLALEL
jgi:hypothetical protein